MVILTGTTTIGGCIGAGVRCYVPVRFFDRPPFILFIEPNPDESVAVVTVPRRQLVGVFNVLQ